MIEQFYLTDRWDPNRYYQLVRMNLGVMAMKEYSAFPDAQELEFYYQMV